MEGLRHKLARLVVRNPIRTLAVAAVITAVFAYGCLHVQAKTIFSDLFPKTHEFVRTYSDHPNFGSPLTVSIMIERTDGKDIYQKDTIEKIWNLSRDIDLIPGIDHDQIVSIATEKARYTVLTADGIYSNPIMDTLPQSEDEMVEVRRRVGESAGARNFLVSRDQHSALVNGTFIERLVDYGVVFEGVQSLVEKYSDANHRVYATGWPVLTGWTYFYGEHTKRIFLVTLAVMFGFLMLTMRNIAGVLTPAIVSGISAVWGFGFVGLIHQPVEPLLMVVPLLLIARSFSHSVQATERYYELLYAIKDKKRAAELSLAVMFAPGALGIFTDVVGLLLVGITPIPAMERFSLFTGFWAMMLVPTSVILTPVLLSLLPAPKNVDTLIGDGKNPGMIQVALNRVLNVFCRLSTEPHGKKVAIGFVVLTIGAAMLMTRLQVGNPVEGSNLLKYDSDFNVAVREENKNFPGVMTLEVIFEGTGDRILRQADTLETMTGLQRCLEAKEHPPTATLSFADYAPEANRLFNGGNPKWSPLDADDASVSAASSALMLGTSPSAYSHVADFEQKNSTVSLWYPNNKQETVDQALRDARACIADSGSEHGNFKIRLATGSIALQQSINDTVDVYQWWILAGLNIVIGAGVALAYRSTVAAVILLAPVNLANMLLTAFMALFGMGLDVNSLPILAIGIGVGIDYGIYMLSRICEEYKDAGHIGDAIKRSLSTCGKAILFTAVLMTIGILPWYLFSELKFLSDMGLLLMVVMTINMVLALVLVPLLVFFAKPAFISNEHSLLSESTDGFLDSVV